MSQFLIGLAVTLALARAAPAQELPVASSAGWMLECCRAALDKPDQPGLRQGMCVGSIGTLLFLGDALPDEYRICRPRGATIYDAVRIVVARVEDQPERRNDNFNMLAMEALSAAWPCG